MKTLTYTLIVLFYLKGTISFGQNPELSVQIGTINPIYSVAVSPDGNKIATGGGWMGNTGEINLWDIETGKQIRSFAGHEQTVYSVKFSPNGKWILSGGDDMKVKIWDIENGNEIASLEGHKNKLKVVAFSPDGKRIISASNDEIKLWDVESRKEIRDFKPNYSFISWLYAVAFSPDGKNIAANIGEKIILWDVETGKEIKTFSGHSNFVQSIAFSPDGKRFVSGGNDYNIKLWDIETGNEIRTITKYSPQIASLAYSPDGKTIIAGSREDYGNLRLYNAETGEEIRRFAGHTSWVNAVSFTPDGRKIVSGSFNDKMLKLWEAETGMLIRSFQGYSRPFMSSAVSSDAKKMVTAQGKFNETGEIRLWDLERGKLVNTFFEHNYEIRAVSISKDGKRILSGPYGGDIAIKLWDAESGKELKTLKGHTNGINAVTFSPDGKTIISGSEGEKSFMIWDAQSGKVIKSNNEIWTIYSLAYSPDGKYFVTGKTNDFALWDASTYTKIKALEGVQSIPNSIVFSPDGKTVLSAIWDNLALLWDVESGKIIRKFSGHNSTVTSACFSPDGKKILTQSYDKTLKTWNVETGKELKTYSSDTYWIPDPSFSTDGERIISGCADNAIKIIDVDSGYIVANFVAVDKNDYIVTTPDNYYTASKGAFKGVAFRIGSKVFPFEQFDLKYNRPDIILQRLGQAPQNLVTSYRNAYLKRLKKMKFTEDMLGNDFHLPEVAIISEGIPSSTPSKNFSFRIKAHDSKYNLDRINVFVNDVPIHGTNGFDIRDKNISELEQEVNLSLLNGDNKVQVSVLNSKGVESLKQTFYIKNTGAEVKPDLYLVAIGVSQYLDTTYNLTYASKDANDIAQFFESKKQNFGKVNIIPFLNQKATREDIINAKQTLMQSKVDDEVVVFFAGHGLLDEKMDYYLATTDIDFNNPAGKGLAYDDLENLVDGIPALKKLVLIDACHSGEVEKDESVLIAANTTPSGTVKSRAVGRGFKVIKKDGLSLDNSYELIKELFADLRRGSGAIVISSAGGAEYALESKEWNNGVFTFSVLEGMKTVKADMNKDGSIKISELKEYVIDKVQTLTKGKQTPTSRQENLEFDFRVW